MPARLRGAAGVGTNGLLPYTLCDERSLHRLSTLSRAETGPPASGETIDLGALAERLAERFAPIAEAKGVVLHRDLASGVVAAADAAGVEVALESLLDNAIKYTPAGGAVTLTVRREGEDATTVVADTGVGFGDGERERLFERFYRADTPEVQGEAGSGLGLAIAQRLAERHGGQIAAESPGHDLGSTFVLRLPGQASSSLDASADSREPIQARPPAT